MSPLLLSFGQLLHALPIFNSHLGAFLQETWLGTYVIELDRKTRVNDMARDPYSAALNFADASIVW